MGPKWTSSRAPSKAGMFISFAVNLTDTTGEGPLVESTTIACNTGLVPAGAPGPADDDEPWCRTGALPAWSHTARALWRRVFAALALCCSASGHHRLLVQMWEAQRKPK
jgi:hypothetical protein